MYPCRVVWRTFVASIIVHGAPVVCLEVSPSFMLFRKAIVITIRNNQDILQTWIQYFFTPTRHRLPPITLHFAFVCEFYVECPPLVSKEATTTEDFPHHHSEVLTQEAAATNTAPTLIQP